MFKKRWFILVVLIFGLGTQAVSIPLEAPIYEVGNTISVVLQTAPDVSEPSDLVLFLGRFHPLLVHLPIGFLLLAFLLEFCALYKRFEQLGHAVPFSLLLGGLSAIGAGVTGYLLSYDGGYGEGILSTHMWLGISVAVLSFVAFVLKLNVTKHPVVKKGYYGVMVLMLATLMGAGHYGGSLTHGSDYLVRYMPGPLRTIAGLPPKEERGIKKIANIDSARVFEDIIHPIVDTKCVSCHNPEKKKGELLLTSYEELMKGGESGAILKAGKSGESEMYKRLVLPEGHDDHMPPDGKEQLTDDQVDLIGWWIDQGAPTERQVASLEVPTNISEAFKTLTGESQGFLEKTKVSPADEKALVEAREQGFQIAPVSDKNHFLQVGLAQSVDTLTKQSIKELLPFKEQLTWLDFGRTQIEEGSLSELSQFKNMTRLNLELTNISNSTLKDVSTLQNLEYLNIYSTGVDNEGLKHLEGNKKLKSLYLWQTKVSKEGVQRLKQKIPNLYVNTGWENESKEDSIETAQKPKSITENKE